MALAHSELCLFTFQMTITNSSSSVGVSGHFAHGGFGFSSHMHGLATDFIEGATVVLADGKIVEVSSKKNADLLWGLRGAGSNFGIVASWKLRTIEEPKKLTRFGLTLGWNKTNALAGLEAVEAYVKDKAPREINFRVADYGAGNPGLEGLYYGTKEQWSKAFEPLLKTLPAGYNVTLAKEVTWLQSVLEYSNYLEIDFIEPAPVRTPHLISLSWTPS